MRDDFNYEKSIAEMKSTWLAQTGGFAKDMALSDHFAGLAMQRLLGDHVRNFDLLAIEAYQMADAMLAVKQSREAK